DWTYTFTNLAKVNKNGDEIAYKVQEKHVPKGFESSGPSGEKQDYNLENTQNTKEVSITKKWDEGTKGSIYRPGEIDVNLTADNGTTYEHTIKGDKDEDSWNDTFKNLPKIDADGDPIHYAIEEDNVQDGYEAHVSDKGHSIT